ncbi:MAG: hypothetical protein PVJ42_08230 [bacterium]|jgi:hypothetical protein
MKKFLIVIVTIVFLVIAAGTGAQARRVPSKRAGDPDEVQSAKQHDEPGMGSRLKTSQGRLALKLGQRTDNRRAKRLNIKVRFPGREFFLEK